MYFGTSEFKYTAGDFRWIGTLLPVTKGSQLGRLAFWLRTREGVHQRRSFLMFDDWRRKSTGSWDTTWIDCYPVMCSISSTYPTRARRRVLVVCTAEHTISACGGCTHSDRRTLVLYDEFDLESLVDSMPSEKDTWTGWHNLSRLF